MNLAVLKELRADETRVALLPADAARLTRLGARVQIEAGLGQGIGVSDEDYQAAGVTLAANRDQLMASADLILRLGPPAPQEVERMKSGAIHLSFLDPFNQEALIRKLAVRGITTISMEMIPRITRAQKMDALSSQANLAGYVAVILAADHLQRIFPMMTTAAGTIQPARVLVIGAGVAGLQAIATAHRLGARVDAFDTRPEVAEQVRSVGGRFVEIDLGETGQTSGGYAQALTEEQLAKQRAALGKRCAVSDAVITAAQVFGRRAPLILTTAMLDQMKKGSVIVDLAVENGGNVAEVVPDQVVDRQGVKIIGLRNLPGRVPFHASQVYSANLANLVEEFWNVESKMFVTNLNDSILQACLVTYQGKICHERLRHLND